MRLDTDGIASLDWERYPVIKFSEVPEIFCELVDPLSDNPPLGIGEATGGPTVAAIGNAVAQALGTRLRDLPMTRERVMAALLRRERCPDAHNPRLSSAERHSVLG